MSAIAAFLLVIGLIAVTSGCSGTGVAPTSRSTSEGAEHVAVGALSGRTGAYLTVRDAASRVRVVLATLPGLLYRISTPAGSGLAPRVTDRNGRVQAVLLPTGHDGPDEVRIVLNRDVRWELRLPAGAGEQDFDLRHGRVSRVDVGASGLLEMRLPAPVGTVPLTFASGIGTAVLQAGPDAPLCITLAEGAGSADTPWTTRGPVPAGGILTAPGWPAAVDRYAIRAAAGIGALTIR
jgi:hypothetical protein